MPPDRIEQARWTPQAAVGKAPTQSKEPNPADGFGAAGAKSRPDSVRGVRLTIGVLLVNTLLAVAKFVTGWVGNSYALIADAVESWADVFGSLVVLGGLRIAARPADQDHPYGYGKAEPLAALFVAMLLFLTGCGIAAASVREIITPHHAPAPYTLFVLLAVVAIKETLHRVMRKEAESIGSSAITVGSSPSLVSSGMNFSAAAAVGIGVALVGGEGYERADDYAALLAAGVIVFNAVRLTRSPLAELMDAEPTDLVQRVRMIAQAVPNVSAVEKILARKCGLRYRVDMHVEVSPQMSVARAHEIAHDVKDAVRTQLPQVEDVLIHIEPARGA